MAQGRFAIVVDNEAVELVRGVPFTLDGLQYPGNLLDLWDPAQMAHIGVLPITENVVVPDGHFLVRKELTVVNGLPVEIGITQQIPLSRLKADKRLALMAKYTEIVDPGMPYEFDGVNETLQVRSADDKVNWLILREECKDQIAAGNGSAQCLLPIRTTVNNEYAVTNTEGKLITDMIRAWFFGKLAALWALKNAIDAATSKAEVDAVNLEVGW